MTTSSGRPTAAPVTIRLIGDFDVLVDGVSAAGLVAASLIRHSRFVALNSTNHILLADEPAWPVFLREVESFLSG